MKDNAKIMNDDNMKCAIKTFEVRFDKKEHIYYLIDLLGKQSFIDIELIDRLSKISENKMKLRKMNVLDAYDKDSHAEGKMINVYCIRFDELQILKIIKMINDDGVLYSNYSNPGSGIAGEVYSYFRFGENAKAGLRYGWITRFDGN